MGRWQGNPSKVNLRELFGPYEEDVEATVIEVKPFEGKPKDDGSVSIAANLRLQMTTGPAAGKSIFSMLWVHTEDALRIAKQAQMAIYGYTSKQEEEFDSWSDQQDWLIDAQANELGTAWTDMKGRVVKLKLDVKPNKQTGELQQIINYRPLTSE
jgi:hypothetical protein